MLGLRAFSPYYYGNPIYLEKFGYLNHTEEEYDLVFMGSSRTLRQVNSKKVDEELSGATRSFNLGAGGTFGLQVLYAAEHLLLERDVLPNMRVLVVELQLPQPIADTNLHAARSKYYIDSKRYNSAADFVRAYYPSSEASLYLRNYRSAWLERMMNLGLIRAQLLSLFSPRNGGHFLGEQENGYVPLDDEIGKRSYQERRRDFIENKDLYLKEFNSNRDRRLEGVDIGEAYLQEHLDLIKLGRRKGIHVVFVLLPGGFHLPQAGAVAIYDQIPSDCRIDVGSQDQWAMLYNPELYFDRGHLNEVGARLLSKLLAEELRALFDRVHLADE
jgi:hypothetical protein